MSLRMYAALAALAGALALPAMAGENKIPPTGKAIKHFNGKNLDGFDTVLKTQGLNIDPEKVLQVEKGIIHVSGAEFGYIITAKEFGHYFLRAEFKWGEGAHDPSAA